VTAHHRAARLYCIPAVWSRVLEHGVGRVDLSRLEEADTGTSATPPELLRAIKDALPHTRTRVFYGSTEAGPGVQLGDADLFQQADRALFQHAGADPRQHVIAVLALQDDVVDADTMQQLSEQHAGRPRADDCYFCPQYLLPSLL